MQFQLSLSGLSKTNIMGLLGCCQWLAVSKHTVCGFVDRCVRISSLRTKKTPSPSWEMKQKYTCKYVAVSHTDIEESRNQRFIPWVSHLPSQQSHRSRGIFDRGREGRFGSVHRRHPISRTLTFASMLIHRGGDMQKHWEPILSILSHYAWLLENDKAVPK